jgi:uncharacterized protein (DUF1684 family)
VNAMSRVISSMGTGLQDLLGWRRCVSSLYAEIRAMPDQNAAWYRWRDTRDRLFSSHSQSPLDAPERSRFGGLPYFGYDPNYRFLAALDPLQDRSSIEVDTGSDGVTLLRPFARTRGLAERLGAELTLYWIEGYGGGVFLPFRDLTSGRDSYGGGRYLLDSIKGADLGAENDRIVLDFNFAYNPSCAYCSRFVCPLAPAANSLPEAVVAGERMP